MCYVLLLPFASFPLSAKSGDKKILPLPLADYKEREKERCREEGREKERCREDEREKKRHPLMVIVRFWNSVKYAEESVIVPLC